jgi:hypothetical protein
LGRFISADSVVPGAADGSLEGVARKPLTVDFHEPGLVAKRAQENQFGPWFQLSDDETQQLGSPWGPANPQALNRYSYVQNNPLRYTDPSGHAVSATHAQAYEFSQLLRQVADILNGGSGLIAVSIGYGRGKLQATIEGLVAARIASGAITTLLGAIVMTVVASALLPAIAFASYVYAMRLTEIADMIDKYNGSNGITLSSECGVLLCDVMVIDNHTGNGEVHEMPITVAGVLFGGKEYRDDGRIYYSQN